MGRLLHDSQSYVLRTAMVRISFDDLSEYTLDLVDKLELHGTDSFRDASWASELYSAALRTKIVRKQFVSAVRHYHDVVASNGGFLEKEEAYYEATFQ